MGEEIKNLEELLSQCIGPSKKVITTTVGRLTAPGENYLSLVLKVDATLLDEETGKEEQFSGVAKCLNPPMDGADWFIEFGKNNYLSELVFYTEIIPTLQKFAKDKGLKRDIDIFPKLLAYRPNLHGKNDEVDEDSVLLLENMTVNGFINIDRHVGFNYEDTLLILRDMALLHALPVALKLKMRHTFETKLKKHIQRNPFGPPPPPKEGEEPRSLPPPMKDIEIYCDILEKYDQCKLYVSRIRRRNESFRETMKEMMDKPKSEPFATISHNDAWVNNTMQIVEGGRVVKNKFVDFQTYNYDSPGQDLIFFIGTSVQLPVIKEHFADLLKYYYTNFIEVLQELGCGTSAFTEEKFEEELREIGYGRIIMILMFYKVVFGKKGELAPLGPGKELREEDISDIMRERAAYLVYIFGRKGWI